MSTPGEPDKLDARTRSAYSLFCLGKSREAAALLIGIIKEHPGFPAPYRLLADVERALGNRTAEAAVLKELVALDPLNAEAWRRLAAAHFECGQSEQAYRCYRRATQLLPSEAANWEGLFAAALSAQRFAQAQTAGYQLLEHFPDRAAAQLCVGHIQKALGNTMNALTAYRAALTLSPNSCEVIYNLVDLSPPLLNDPLAEHARTLLASAKLKDADAANLNFALARIFEAAAHYEQAFAHYQQANAAAARAMCSSGLIYQPADSEQWVATALSTYTSTSFRRVLEPLPIALRPIFVVGMPRSGTSLIEQILASHPQVSGGGEISIARDCELLYANRRQESGLSGPIDPYNDREYDLLLEIRELYLDMLFERDLDSEYITDKLPGNFARLGFLRLLFPESIIVHCRRQPAATCWSLFAANFALHDPYYNSLDHLAHYYGCYERLVSYWRSILSPALVEIQYEHLVLNPDVEVRRLIEGIGLPWDEQCMAFHENRRPVLTASYSQVRRPPYTTSLDRWRHFEPHLSAFAQLR
jgi:tetratricopeptide (TPR) repeat protein